MSRALTDSARRVVTLETGRRSVDLPTDAAGHIRRHRANADIAVRAAGDGGDVGITGHAAVFGQRTWIGSKRWGFWEVIEPGAFAKTIREKRGENNDITLNRDHDNMQLLARTSNGTLRLAEDDVGLAVDADMGDYSYARDIATALDRRDLTGMSFAFDVVVWEWSYAEDDNELLTLRELELFDTAIVGMPAYAGTDASLRGDLLAAARAQGFDEPMIASLAKRLADPDDELVTVLRALAGPGSDRNTQPPSGPAPATRDDSPPAETTGEPTAAQAAAAYARRRDFRERQFALLKEM